MFFSQDDISAWPLTVMLLVANLDESIASALKDLMIISVSFKFIVI